MRAYISHSSPIDPRGYFPSRALYQTGVVILFLLVVGLLWFALWAVITPIFTAVNANMAQYDVEGSTHASYETAYTFMVNFWQYLLALAVFGLLYWVYIYSQRKSARSGFY